MTAYKKYLLAIPLGFLAGVLTIYVISSKFEIFAWLLLIILLGLSANKFYTGKLFINTFLLSALTGIVITLTHILFLNDYLSSHPEETAMLKKTRLFNSDRLTLLVIAPVYWITLGILAGLAGVIIRRANKS